LEVPLKIVITTYQICSAIPVALTVAFPSQFAGYLSAMTVFNLNVMSSVPINCANQGEYNFIDKLVMLTLAPIGLSLLLLLACIAEYSYRRVAYERLQIEQITEEERDVHEKKLAGVIFRYLTLFFLLTYLVLPFIATTLFRTFLCTNLDPNDKDSDPDDLFLTADMRISCTSDYYKRGVAYAAVMIVVYVVGIPLMYLILLYRSRKEIMERFDAPASHASVAASEVNLPATDPESTAFENCAQVDGATDKAGDFASAGGEGEQTSNYPDGPKNELLARHDHAARHALMISFLYESYEPRFWYWEVVETTRRLMLTAVLSVCGPGTSAQVLLAILLALMYIKLYGYYAPYLKVSDDIMAETGQFQIFLSFLGALVYQRHLLGEEWNNAVGALLILINTAVFILFVYFAGQIMYRGAKTVNLENLSSRLSGRKTKPQAMTSEPATTSVSRSGPGSAKIYIMADSGDRGGDVESAPLEAAAAVE
jgi:hypothetical protein